MFLDFRKSYKTWNEIFLINYSKKNISEVQNFGNIIILNSYRRFNPRVGIVIFQREIFKIKIKNILDFRIELHRW
ncbi:Uncharacterised protein [Chryseobacterium taklimakanense]|uniref:Uncharacterized protein n=1 Tax=Chryseobacterium taklimakanense TaxID=536441 RepID=A0A239X533_9FLAO|nr:Uncharacterised protein [Chryseobacterium taklimakanense]